MNPVPTYIAIIICVFISGGCCFFSFGYWLGKREHRVLVNIYKKLFTIRTDLPSFTDEEGKKYIINPLTKERIYEFIPEPIEIKSSVMKGSLEPIPGLFPEVNSKLYD